MPMIYVICINLKFKREQFFSEINGFIDYS